VARATLALCGIVLSIAQPSLSSHPILPLAAFLVILITAAVQMLVPGADWLTVEESLAPVAAVLIVGLGNQRVTVLSLLWLAAVASGVLARGGRVHWLGRALLLGSLALPVVREQRITLQYAGLCVAVVALLLTCGRVTQELRTLLSRARWEADHDALTGLLSRAAFRRALDTLARREDVRDGALLLVDLDNFGAVNKANGHAAGDAVLVSVAQRIRECVGPDVVVGRLGGDEFAAVLQHPEPEALARAVLDKLERAAGDHQSVVASVGIAAVPADGQDADTLLRAADIALRVAKRSGRRQLSLYAGESLSDRGPGGAHGALRRLIAGEGLAIVVQPIVDPATGEVHAFEALARFQTRGTSSPLHWFALADEFDLRDELELACMSAALELLGSQPRGTRLSVNLSGPLLLDPRTQALLDGLPTLTGLILEVTENSLLDDSPRIQAAISELLSRGVHLAVDDMGAGYSGLRQIATVHPTYLKLDRSLIQGIDGDPDRGALISALSGYAKQTGGYLVAEGVETAAELQTLTGLGVPLVQGFHLCRPGPPWPVPQPGAVGEAMATVQDPPLATGLALPLAAGLAVPLAAGLAVPLATGLDRRVAT
jgi:diguanylate cyclase (GGDEF)-like protein